MPLPYVRLRGSPFEQGLCQGRVLRDRIDHNIRTYLGCFAALGLSEDEVRERSRRYARAIELRHPRYFETMRGISEGAGQSLEHVTSLNVRYEIMYYQFGAGADGCSAFALAPERTAAGHLLLGQNWDWLPQVQGALLHCDGPGGLEHLAFTEAGIAGGKIGLNSAGLGLAINGLVTLQDDWQRLASPFHVRCYDILRQPTLAGASRLIECEPRACSANFLLAQPPGRIEDIEAAPDVATRLAPDSGQLVHTNHFLGPRDAGVTELEADTRACSLHRCARLGAGLARSPKLSLEEVQDALRDHDGHPNSVCRHPDEAEPEYDRFATVTSIVMDLHERVLYVSDGPPCASEYMRYRL